MDMLFISMASPSVYIYLLFLCQVIVEQFVKSNPNGLKMMYTKLLEFVPHHCRLLREVTGGAISRYD